MHNHSNSIKIRHTANARERLQQAHKLMGISNQLSNELEELFNRWTTVRITDSEVKRLIELALAPTKETLEGVGADRKSLLSAQFQNVCEQAFTYAMSNPTQTVETTKGTLFGAYNAVTGYYENVRNYKDEEAKLKSIVLGGTAQQRTTKAFRLCLEFMRHGNSALHLN